MTKKCVSCMSGGMDSFAISVLLNKRGFEIYPIFFDYNQRTKNKEEEVADYLCNKMGYAKPIKIKLSGDLEEMWKGLQLVDRDTKVRRELHPSVIVPLRDIIFLTVASSYALRIGAEAVSYGAIADDDIYFPDCRPKAAKLFEELVKYAHPPAGISKIEVISPSVEGLSKYELVKIVYDIVGDLLFETWSCYGLEDKHCGECASCLLRHEAFVRAGIKDKTEYLKPPEVSKQVE